MKNALAKKMLNAQLGKLPYTESELGEGMAVQAVQKKSVSQKYDQFKSLAKVVEIEKKELAGKVKVIQKLKVAAEKKEMKARAAAAKLRIQLRTAKAKQAPPGMGKSDFDALKKKLAAASGKVGKEKAKVKAAKKQEKKDVAKVKKFAEKTIEADKKKLAKEIKGDRKQMKNFEKQQEKNFALKSGTMAKEAAKVTALQNKVKHLKSEVKSDDQKVKDVKVGIKAKMRSEERDIIRKEEKKVVAAQNKANGEMQKEAWDKTKTLEAKAKVDQEKSVMGAAVTASANLAEKEKTAEGQLKSLKKQELDMFLIQIILMI